MKKIQLGAIALLLSGSPVATGGERAAAAVSRRAWQSASTSRHARHSAAAPQDPSPAPQPGALIRTAGLGAIVSAPSSAPSLLAFESGRRITYEESRGQALTNAPGLFVGLPDKLPPPNPVKGSAGAGGNSITPNR